jgi:hypothetical protein
MPSIKKTRKKHPRRKSGNAFKSRHIVTRNRPIQWGGACNGPNTSDAVEKDRRYYTPEQNKQRDTLLKDATDMVARMLDARFDAEKDDPYKATRSATPSKTEIIVGKSPGPTKLFTDKETENIVDLLKTQTCDDIKHIIPAFYRETVSLPERVVVNKEKEEYSYTIGPDTYYTHGPDTNENAHGSANLLKNLNYTNYVLCTIIIVVGIISARLQETKSDYIIVTKGGLSAALIASKLAGSNSQVTINDLDFKVMPNPYRTDIVTYNREAAHLIAEKICDDIKHLIDKVIKTGYGLSKLDRFNSSPSNRGHADIIKLSLRPSGGGFIPIVDMDFSDNEKSAQYFSHVFHTNDAITIKETDLAVRFTYQSDMMFLTEKFHYLAKYLFVKRLLTNTLHNTKLPNVASIKNRTMKVGSPLRTVFGMMQYTPLKKATRSKQNETAKRMGSQLKQTPNEATVTVDGEMINIYACERFIEKFTKSIIIVLDALIQANMDLMPETIACLAPTDTLKVSFTTTLARLILLDKRIGKGIKCEIQETVVDNIYPRFHLNSRNASPHYLASYPLA